jgi:hypothetical protein
LQAAAHLQAATDDSQAAGERRSQKISHFIGD